MDKEPTWYGSRPRPRPHCIRRGPRSPRKRHSSSLFSAHVYCGHGRPSQLLLSSCYYYYTRTLTFKKDRVQAYNVRLRQLTSDLILTFDHLLASRQLTSDLILTFDHLLASRQLTSDLILTFDHLRQLTSDLILTFDHLRQLTSDLYSRLTTYSHHANLLVT